MLDGAWRPLRCCARSGAAAEACVLKGVAFGRPKVGSECLAGSHSSYTTYCTLDTPCKREYPMHAPRYPQIGGIRALGRGYGPKRPPLVRGGPPVIFSRDTRG
jgi:hypothetical protein